VCLVSLPYIGWFLLYYRPALVDAEEQENDDDDDDDEARLRIYLSTAALSDKHNVVLSLFGPHFVMVGCFPANPITMYCVVMLLLATTGVARRKNT